MRSIARPLLVFGALACSCAAWALWPVAIDPEAGRRLRVCLVDASASVQRTRPSWRTWLETQLRTEARAAEDDGRQLLVVGYAADVVRWFGPGDAADFDVSRDVGIERVSRLDASDLSAALVGVEQMAGELERAQIELRLFGDGTFSGADPSSALSRWRRDGASVEFIEVPPQEVADLALGRCETAEVLEVDAPLSALVTFVAPGARTARRARFEATVSDDQGSRSFVREESVGESARSVRFDFGPMREGWTRVRIRGSLAGDPTPENDLLEVSVRSRDALAIGWMASPESTDDVRIGVEGLRALGGFSLFELAPERLPASVGELDLLLTFDLDPRVLPDDALHGFLDRGGAWLACGGFHLLAGLDARAEHKNARLLPLELDDTDSAPREVFLLVDASGSMAGESTTQARRAAEEMVTAARSSDDLALYFFTDELGARVALGTGGGGEEDRGLVARSVLAARAPGGPTDIAAVLEHAARERASDVQRALIVLLSDGRDQKLGRELEQRLESALQRFSELQTRLVVLPIGERVDTEFLQLLDRPAWGASVAERGRDAREVVREELSRERVREGPIGVAVARVNAQSPDVWAAEFVEALAASGGPKSVARALRVRERDGASVLLVDDQQRALLAVQRIGRGLSACFASLPFSAWAPEWTADPSRWAPLLRGLARAAARTREDAPSLRFVDPDRWIVERAPSHWPDRLSLELPASSPGETRRVELAIEAHPAFPWGARRTAQWGGVELNVHGLEVPVLDEAGGRVAQLWLGAQGQPEFSAFPRRFWLPSGPTGSFEVALGPRHGLLGWVSLVLGVLGLALGAAAGAVSSFAPARTVDQGESLSGR